MNEQRPSLPILGLPHQPMKSFEERTAEMDKEFNEAFDKITSGAKATAKCVAGVWIAALAVSALIGLATLGTIIWGVGAALGKW